MFRTDQVLRIWRVLCIIYNLSTYPDRRNEHIDVQKYSLIYKFEIYNQYFSVPNFVLYLKFLLHHISILFGYCSSTYIDFTLINNRYTYAPHTIRTHHNSRFY
jgi:hypothetical protein